MALLVRKSSRCEFSESSGRGIQMIPKNAATRSFSRLVFPGYEKPDFDKQKRMFSMVAIVHVVDKWSALGVFWACRKQIAGLQSRGSQKWMRFGTVSQPRWLNTENDSGYRDRKGPSSPCLPLRLPRFRSSVSNWVRKAKPKKWGPER